MGFGDCERGLLRNSQFCGISLTLKHSMASFARRPSRPWTIDECALFAARKEFELLKLLSTDKKAMAAARRLGLHAVLPQPLPAKATAGKPAAASTRTPPSDAPSKATSAAKSNSRRKRSATRSARHHAKRREQLCNRCSLAMLFVVKLRRRVRAKVLVQDLADLESLSDGSGSNPMSKEVPLERRQSVATLKRGDRPPSSCSASSSASSRCSSGDTPMGSYKGRRGWDCHPDWLAD
jgi:hypothetical protein